MIKQNNDEREEIERLHKGFSELIPKYQVKLDDLRGFFFAYQQLQSQLDLKSIPLKIEEYINIIKEMNFKGFLTLTMLEIIIIQKNMIGSSDTSEKTFFSKTAHLLIYEAINTFQKHNVVVYKLIKSRYPELNILHKEASLKLRTFKVKFKYDTTLAKIRNQIGGHIAEKFTDYYDLAKTLNHEQCDVIISEFIDVIFVFKKVSDKLAQVAFDHIQDDFAEMDLLFRDFIKNKL